MTLRNKILPLIAMIFLSAVLILYFVSHNILLDSFVKIEERHTHQDVERAVNALSAELSSLDLSSSNRLVFTTINAKIIFFGAFNICSS